MSAARLKDLIRLRALRQRRVELAERALAAAVAEVRAAEARLVACDRVVAEIDGHRARLDAWFMTGIEARVLPSALARREALMVEREAALREREAADQALQAAQAVRAECAAALGRARAKANAAELQLSAARRRQARLDEARAEAEREPGRFTLSLMGGA